ncbi:hypothetical protein [Flavobacterium sp.]|uniref:hypothetical protein n=4 Tax=Flavobacterium sp. TaxID=239 RepID=UPI0040475974
MNSLKYVFGFLLVFTFLSCEEVLMEDDISDETIVLLAPADNAQFFSTSVTLTWEPVQYATKYRLQIAKPNFATATEIVLDTELTTTSFTQQLNIGDYEWRVKAINSAYETNYVARRLTVVSNDEFDNNIVVLNNPSNSLNSNSVNQTLSWNAVIGATSYQLQIFDNSSTLVSNQTLATTSYSHTFTEGNFTWKVRASNGTDYTLYSSRTILIDTTLPNVPTLTAPTNASTTSSSNISFNWNRIPISGSQEFDSLYVYSNVALTNLVLKKRVTNPHSETILDNGTYYWRMKSFDEAGNVSAASSTFSFTKN